MLRTVYLVFILLAFYNKASFASMQSKPTMHAVLKNDSSIVNLRHFDKASLERYRKNPDFQYGDTDINSSFWTRFWRVFWNWLTHLFDFLKLRDHHSRTFFQVVLLILEYVFIVLGLAAIVFFILKLAGMDMLNLFGGKPLSANLPYDESLENIHEIDFDAEIEKAVTQHNYRLAVRMLYLRSLKQLSDATLIKWQPEKTNNAYVNELDNAEQRMAFKLLTYQFEYIWYGEFVIDGNIFKNINFMFQKFKDDIA